MADTHDVITSEPVDQAGPIPWIIPSLAQLDHFKQSDTKAFGNAVMRARSERRTPSETKGRFDNRL